MYCKDGNGNATDAQSDDGFVECSAAFLNGEACFTGSRKEVIELINSDYFNWDEEWVAEAHFKGADSITYLYVDGPNETTEKLSMERCAPEFFKR